MIPPSFTIDFASHNFGESITTDPQSNSILSAPEPWFINFATGNPTGEAGPAVNEFTAYNYLAVFDCVSLIASKISELPLVAYRDDGQSRKPAKDRSEYNLLLTEFNPETSAMIGREAGIGHLLTWGNSFTQIVRNKSGSTILELRCLGPDLVRPVRQADGSILYEIYKRGTAQIIAKLDPEEIIHVPGLSFDGLIGYSPIRVARSAIRSGMAQDKEAESYITRGIRPPGAIKFPPGQKFRDETDAIDYRNRFQRIHSTGESARQIVVLENGADWVSMGIDPKSAQLLDSRKYSRKEICGLYRVPPHLIGDVDASTSWGTGIAEQTQGFVDFCLMGWISRIEAELKRKLAKDDPEIYYRHCTEELLRGDLLKRTQAREIQHRRGIITDNEWRIDEHLNPVEGGDVRHFPLNEGRVDESGDSLPMIGDMSGSSTVSPKPQASQANDGTESVGTTVVNKALASTDVQATALNGAQIASLVIVCDRLANKEYTRDATEAMLQGSFPNMSRALIKTIVDELEKIKAPAQNPPANDPGAKPDQAPPQDQGRSTAENLIRESMLKGAARCLRKEAEQAKRAAGGKEGNFIAWVDQFYIRHEEMVEEHAGKAAAAFAALFGGNGATYAQRHIERSRRELMAAAECEPSKLAENVERCVERWQGDRLAEVAIEFSRFVNPDGRGAGLIVDVKPGGK